MGTPVDSGKVIGESALIAISAAACVIPDAWVIAGEGYKMQCDPGAMYAAGQAWLDSAGKLGEALNAAISVNNQIAATGWQGADEEAFTEKVGDYVRQMMIAQVFAYTVGVAVILAAIESFFALVVLAAMAVGLAAFAVAILAAAASVVGDLGPMEALEADASLFAVDCEVGLRELDGATKVTDAVLAGGIGVFLAGDVGFQVGAGNTGALADVAQATVDSMGTVLAGLTARVFRDAVGGTGGMGATVGRGPLNEVITALGLTTTFTGSPADGVTAPIDPVPH
jgi:hypothetical protein